MYVREKRFISYLLVAALGFSAACMARAQTSPDISFAVTYDAVDANLTTSNAFWMNGGAAEVNATLYKGFGAIASVSGLHTGNSGNNIPVSLFVATFGPSYKFGVHHGKHGYFVTGHALVGEADGFKGLYPSPSGAIPSSDALALQVGGSFDIDVSRHVAVRVLEADWLRTDLPNSTTNVQNNLRLGIGIVLHPGSGKK